MLIKWSRMSRHNDFSDLIVIISSTLRRRCGVLKGALMASWSWLDHKDGRYAVRHERVEDTNEGTRGTVLQR